MISQMQALRNVNEFPYQVAALGSFHLLFTDAAVTGVLFPEEVLLM